MQAAYTALMPHTYNVSDTDIAVIVKIRKQDFRATFLIYRRGFLVTALLLLQFMRCEACHQVCDVCCSVFYQSCNHLCSLLDFRNVAELYYALYVMFTLRVN